MATKQDTFADYVTKLSEADSASRIASGDATQARSARSTVAIETIHAAFQEKLAPEDVRSALVNGGVLKGTVSKIVTVLTALQNGFLFVSDVKSLNGAYTAAKDATVKAAIASGVATAVPFALAPAGVKATTPEEAFELIINAIKSVTDPDEAFKLGGEWITKITNGITEALAERDEDEEGEEEGE